MDADFNMQRGKKIVEDLMFRSKTQQLASITTESHLSNLCDGSQSHVSGSFTIKFGTKLLQIPFDVERLDNETGNDSLRLKFHCCFPSLAEWGNREPYNILVFNHEAQNLDPIVDSDQFTRLKGDQEKKFIALIIESVEENEFTVTSVTALDENLFLTDPRATWVLCTAVKPT